MTHAEFVEAVRALLEAFDAPAAAPAPEVLRVLSGSNLQAALSTSADIIELQPGGTYPDVMITRSVTIIGNGAHLHGMGVPALHVSPGVSGVRVSDLVCTASDWNGAVVQLGNADSQQIALSQVPSDIRLERVMVPMHRGKRGFAIHSTVTDLIDCEAHNIWIPGQDSQPWWIHNTPGKIRIIRGKWSAGSELCLFGGAGFNIPGCIPTTVEVNGGLYYRPVEWQTDGLDREVKCGLEIKNAADVWFHNLTVRGCWQFAQPVSAAFMLTPAQGGSVVNVRIEDIDLENCTDVLSVSGRDAAGINQTQTTGIVVRRVRGTLRKGTSKGVLLLAQRGVGTIDIEDCVIETDGTKLAEFVDQTERFYLTGSTCTLGKYGITFGGFHASVTADPFAPNVTHLKLDANTFSGLGATSKFRQRFPLNGYV